MRPNRRAQPLAADTGWLVIGGVLAVAMFVGVLGWLAALTNPGVDELGRRDPFTVLAAVLTGKLSPAPLQVDLPARADCPGGGGRRDRHAGAAAPVIGIPGRPQGGVDGTDPRAG